MEKNAAGRQSACAVVTAIYRLTIDEDAKESDAISPRILIHSVEENKGDCKKRSHRQDVGTPMDDGANADNFVVYLAEFGDFIIDNYWICSVSRPAPS